jgi:ABC-type polysaccharide/polyol phosphate transport system ATPase subunit
MADTKYAIDLDHVTKRYVQLQDTAMLLKSVMPFTRPNRSDLYALRDVSFKIEPGETVGVLGRNGAGKSTLMRLLAGVTSPTEGVVKINGRVAPLLSVGVGFHPEMSGRENIHVNAMLLGLTRSEITALFDDIVHFAEIEDFIDTPVKFYSSGMYMRLGFSVAIHVTPQILLIDEILAVGDVAFQVKCFDRMRELQNRGTTIIIVSHFMHAIRLLCPRVLLFRKGVMEFDGDAEGAIGRHHELLALDSEGDNLTQGDMPVTILGRKVTRDGVEVNTSKQEDQLQVTWTVRFNREVDSPQATFRILAEDSTVAYSIHTRFGDQWRTYQAGETAEVTCKFQPRFGGGGTFRLLIDVSDRIGVAVLGTDLEGPTIYVDPRLATMGAGDAQATIEIGGELLSNWGSLLFGAQPTNDAELAERSAPEVTLP